MTTWKNGVTRANNWKEQRDQHAAKDMAILVMAPPNQVMSEDDVTGQGSSPARHQNEFTIPHCLEFSRVIKLGRVSMDG